MKRLGLLRHAKSDWEDGATRDFDRGLNERGRRGAAAIGAHIAAQGFRWDAVIASPAERVRRTLEATGLPLVPAYNERIYLADVPTLIDVLRGVAGDPGSVMLVGHNPGLQELIFRLVDPAKENALFERAAEKFPTAAFAVLELGIKHWADLASGCATLVHFARPRDLDPELGPAKVRRLRCRTKALATPPEIDPSKRCQRRPENTANNSLTLFAIRQSLCGKSRA